jgi:ribosomal-protein-alanine N-acetyltransferase
VHVIRAARFVLRRVEERDREPWIEGLRASRELHDPWTPLRGPDWTPEAAWDRMWDMESHPYNRKMVAVAGDGRIAAWVNLNEIVYSHTMSATAGWSVNAQFAGQGVATEAVMGLLDYAFAVEPDGVGLHRVACGIMPENVRSLRVAEKCGFRREGFAPKLVRIAGEWRDHVLFGKLAEEHSPARGAPED